MDLTEARSEIQRIDLEMAALFRRRMACAAQVAAYKKARGLPVLDSAQEARVLQAGAERMEDPALRPYYLHFLQDVMDVSKRYQRRLMDGARIAYSGVEGAFAHIATERIFPDGLAVSFASFADAYAAVEDGDCDCAVLPVENSYAGEVGQVADLMFNGPLHVNGVYALHITQNLLGTRDAALEQVRTVVSHPQALSQCQGYILAHGFAEQSASNTAVAAQMVAERGDPTVAAIASRETARLYGLKILDHDVNESKTNTTRFAVFSRAENRPGEASGEKNTFILMFTVNNVAGALAGAINVIGRYGFNMRALRSRPMKTLPWQYYFYVEAEGNDRSGNGREMLKALAEHCPVLKIAGRFPGEILLQEDEAL